MSRGPERPAPLLTSRSSRCWWPPWRPRRPTPPIGRLAAWPASLACRSRPSAGSGRPSGSSPTWSTPSSCPPTPVIEKVRDVVGMYLYRPQAAMVLCVDENTGVRALDRTPPDPALLPGTPQRATHDYTRHGTTNLYAALEVAGGKVVSQLTPRHRAMEFKRFLDRIDKQVPAGLDVHLICDNSSTHKTPAIHRWLVRHPRFHLHFTPTYSSWLNLVERWFAELTTSGCAGGPTARWRSWSSRSNRGSTPGTRIRGRLCGPRPPMRSSTPSPPTASESTTRDTRALSAEDVSKLHPRPLRAPVPGGEPGNA